MLARIRSAAVLGVDAYLMDVEVDISNGMPTFTTVGLPHGAVKEGRDRVSAALLNAGFQFPLRRITVNLAPADIRKDGSALDLPIALGILVASGQLPGRALEPLAVLGEVGLEGDLRPVRGALSMALAARAAGCAGLLLPEANIGEAAVVEGLEVIRVVREMLGATSGLKAAPGTVRGDFSSSRQMNLVHGSDGPEAAKREIALYFKDQEICGYEPTITKWMRASDEK